MQYPCLELPLDPLHMPEGSYFNPLNLDMFPPCFRINAESVFEQVTFALQFNKVLAEQKPKLKLTVTT